jgi:Zn-dependent protease/CBS domain-containing protein
MLGRRDGLFEMLGFKVQLGVSWVFLAVLVTWSLAQGYFPDYYLGISTSTYWWMGGFGAVGLFGSILFHEFAHSIVARRQGMPIRSITLFIFGGVAQMDKEPPSPKAELLMAIAGPISSFALSAACYLAFKAGYQVHLPLPALGVLDYLAFANSLLGGLNLIPAFPLDGGRALRASLWQWKKDLRRATRWASRVGTMFGLVLMLSGIAYVITGNFLIGFWWFIIGLFLRGVAEASYDQVIAQTVLEVEPVRRFMISNPATVPSNLPLDEWVEEHFHQSFHDMYPVVDDSRLIGCVSSKQISRIPREQWKQLAVRDIVVPCSDDNTVGIDTGALAALSTMHRTGNSWLMVIDGDHLAGIVTLKDLLKLLVLKLDLERGP